MKNLKPLFTILMCATLCLTTVMVLSGCSHGSSLPANKSLEISLDNVWPNESDADVADPSKPVYGSSYNRETHVLVSKGGAGIHMDLGPENTIDGSEYNSMKIKYQVLNNHWAGTIFCVRYNNGTSDGLSEAYYLPSYMTEFEIPLNQTYKGKIRGFFTYTWGKPAMNTEIRFDSISLETKSLSAPTNPNYSNLPAVVDTASAGKNPINRNLDAFDIINDLGPGANLCSLFNSCSGEVDFGLDSWTIWQCQIPTYKERVDELYNMGFTTIRVVVSWGVHMMDDNCTIDPRFMTQVKECVDYCLGKGMYVILDEDLTYKYPDREYSSYYKGYCLSRDGYSYSKKYLTKVWEQITKAFNNSYDEHLIFEFLNEPNESPETFDDNTSADAYNILAEYYQTILNIVRASGGNNAKRFCIVSAMGSGKYPDIECNPDYLTLPTDSSGTGRIIFCTHMYPMLGAGGEPFAHTQYTAIHRANLQNTYQNLCNWYVDNPTNPVPVIVTEFASNSSAPLDERYECIEDYVGTLMSHEGGGFSVILFNYNPDVIDFSKKPFTWSSDHKKCFEYYVRLVNDHTTQRPSAPDLSSPEKAGVNLLKKEVVWGARDWDKNWIHLESSEIGALPDEATLKITVKLNGSSTHKLEVGYLDIYDNYRSKRINVEDADIDNATLLGGTGERECNLEVTGNATIIIDLDAPDTEYLSVGGLHLAGENIKITSIVFE